jgi:hypothetical protein
MRRRTITGREHLEDRVHVVLDLRLRVAGVVVGFVVGIGVGMDVSQSSQPTRCCAGWSPGAEE